MTDIVDRLREGVWGRARRADAAIQAVMQEGADEIERLRKDNADLLILVDMTRDFSMGHQERSERLRAERKELRDLLVGLGAGIPAAAILRAEDRHD